MLLSFWESLQLQMGRTRSTNVTSCPLWLNYCFRLHPLTVGRHKLWHKRISHSTAHCGLAAVGGRCEAPRWQDAQGYSLTTAPDEQSSEKGRWAHKCVVTKEHLLHETSFWSRLAAKGPLPFGWCQKHATPVPPPHHHLLLVLATGLFGLQSASEAWKTAEIVLFQTSLVTQSFDGGFAYENKIIIYMLFLKKEIRMRIITVIIGNIHIHIIVVVVTVIVVVLNATAEHKDALTQTGRSNRSLLEAKRAFQDVGSC